MKKDPDDTEKINRLRLIRTAGIGPVTFHRLMEKHRSAGAAIRALPEYARNSGRSRPLRITARAEAVEELERASRNNVQTVFSGEPGYPQALAAIYDHPPVLFVRGTTSLFEKPAIAIVGARNASGAGCKMARRLAGDLGAAGLVVVSGLARGIDGAAHDAALATGTVAVVAGGTDIVYPPEHTELTERIAAQGAVISEQPEGYQPVARDFPRRNRLISGLSQGVIIVEAAVRSGTLITAGFAGDQGREVFAIPGSPLDPRCQGVNRLIRDGATLVQSAEDVLEVLAAQNRTVREEAESRAGYDDGADEEAAVYDETVLESFVEQVAGILGYAPLHRDDILNEAGAAPGLVADALLTLTLRGDIVEHDGGYFSLAVPD